MKTEDKRYFLNTALKESPFYKRYKEMIEMQGSIEVKDGNNAVRIYNPYLIVILTTENLSVQSLKPTEDTTINGVHYLKTYIQGYNEGLEYFNREFAVTPDTLYSSKYVDDIHYNYFHAKHPGGLIGWQNVKGSYPMIFTHKSIKRLGYYSGIVSKVEGLIKKYPKRFENFLVNNESSVEPFPKYFTPSIPDDKKEAFAERLKAEFCNEKNLPFRYMLEGLKQLGLITWTVYYGKRKAFYDSLEAYFDRDIGSIGGIFDKKEVVYEKGKDKANIDKAIDRINPIFLQVIPQK